MFVSPAYAQGAAPAADGSFLVSLLPIILIFVIFYFLLIRPQQKKAKDHRAMVDALKRGDMVVTAGGIIGKVQKVVSPTEVEVEIADRMRVRVVRHTITEVLSRTEPQSAARPAKPQPEESESGEREQAEKK